MKILFCLLICGLILPTACHETSRETFIQPQEQEFPQSDLSKHLQDIIGRLDQFTPSEQVFFQSLHQKFPQFDQFVKEGKPAEILQLKKFGRNRILVQINIDNRNSFHLLNQRFFAPMPDELFDDYQKEVIEGYQSWSCKEWCIIRAEQNRISSIRACIYGKGDEHECGEEAEVQYFYDLTDCLGDC